MKKISVLKLKSFNSAKTTAIYTKDGMTFEAVKVRKSWFLTGNYSY